MLFFSRSQNITEQMRETLSQDNVSVGDEVSEEQRRPRRTRNVPPSGEKRSSVPDESMESPVEDSDDDKDYKYSRDHKFIVFCFALLLPQILDYFQNQGQFWNLLVLTISKHPLLVQFEVKET